MTTIKQDDESLNISINNKQLYHYLLMYFDKKLVAKGGLNDHDFYDLDHLLCTYLKKDCVVCEIGSWTGMSTVLIGIRTREKKGKMYAVDNFIGLGNLREDGENYDIQAILKETLVLYNVDSVVKIIAKNSVEASNDFPDDYFDFVFIDANHSTGAVTEDIRHWYPKLKEGGLICGHDYQHESVKKAVNEFFEDVKIVDHIRKNSPIWYKVKERNKGDNMNKHISENDSDLWEVIDLNTGKHIRGVQYANDETGKYIVLDLDENGCAKYEKCSSCGHEEVIEINKQGNIKLVKKGIGENK